jgi:hypothetical protein|tara:strand:+ start:108 stop:731 length:624 start_codon:yes stop_codon:yes gene_type:complete
MEQIKSETIKIVTPVGTRFRYSWLVTPDEYKGVEKWKTEAIIPVGEASQKIAQQLEDLIEGWKAQLKAAFPKREFTLTKSQKTGKPSFPWSFEDEGLIIRLKKNVRGVKGNLTPITMFKHDPATGQNLLMTEEQRAEMDKISPETTGQISFLASGYDAGANGVGIKCMPLSICFREIVPFSGGASDFETTEPASYEEKETVSSGADF